MGTIITPKYVIIGGKGTKGTVYNQQTGEKITKFNKKQKDEINKLASYGRTSLHYSDLLNNHNLLLLLHSCLALFRQIQLSSTIKSIIKKC